MTVESPANWHLDPFLRHDLRYWDGAQWTEHVVTRGVQSTDLPVVGAPSNSSLTPTTPKSNRAVQKELRQAGVVPGEQASGGTLLGEPVLVVNQKAKLIEVNAQYAIYNQYGHQIGAVQEVGQNLLKKAVHADLFGTRRFRITDASGNTVIFHCSPRRRCFYRE
jgi:hypothetical protein